MSSADSSRATAPVSGFSLTPGIIHQRPNRSGEEGRTKRSRGQRRHCPGRQQRAGQEDRHWKARIEHERRHRASKPGPLIWSGNGRARCARTDALRRSTVCLAGAAARPRSMATVTPAASLWLPAPSMTGRFPTLLAMGISLITGPVVGVPSSWRWESTASEISRKSPLGPSLGMQSLRHARRTPAGRVALPPQPVTPATAIRLASVMGRRLMTA